jgi:hypothetical protein
VLSNAERRSLYLYCCDHAVAKCCWKPLKPDDLEADLIPVRQESLCPQCRRSLIEEVRAHLQQCPAVLSTEAEEGSSRAISTILVVILIVLIGSLLTWPYSSGSSYYPSGGLGLLVLTCSSCC